MRISALQRRVLWVFATLESKGHKQPLPVMDLLGMLNRALSRDIYATNLRASLHTLHKHGLLIKYRNDSLHLAFTLSDYGRRKVAELKKEDHYLL